MVSDDIPARRIVELLPTATAMMHQLGKPFLTVLGTTPVNRRSTDGAAAGGAGALAGMKSEGAVPLFTPRTETAVSPGIPAGTNEKERQIVGCLGI